MIRIRSRFRSTSISNLQSSYFAQSYQKALMADASYKPAAECLAIVLTDLGTSLKLAGNTQEGIQKYYEALKIDPHYAVLFLTLYFFTQFYVVCLGTI